MCAEPLDKLLANTWAGSEDVSRGYQRKFAIEEPLVELGQELLIFSVGLILVLRGHARGCSGCAGGCGGGCVLGGGCRHVGLLCMGEFGELGCLCISLLLLSGVDSEEVKAIILHVFILIFTIGAGDFDDVGLLNGLAIGAQSHSYEAKSGVRRGVTCEGGSASHVWWCCCST